MTPYLGISQRHSLRIITCIISTLLSTSAFCKSTNSHAKTDSKTSVTVTDNWWSTLYKTPPVLGPTTKFIKENTGLSIKGSFKGTFYGNIAGGKNSGAAWDQEIKLTGIYDFGFITQSLEGLSLTGEMRWREGQNPNTFIGAPSSFNVSSVQSGKYFRYMRLYFTYTTPSLFDVKDFLTISGGWANPYDVFLQQPLSKVFTNNIFESAKGVGANISWSSSYAAWGGYLKIKPTNWAYTQAGLYMAIPGATSNQNHGFYFQGNTMQPGGVFAVAETGFTPKIGPAKLPGKYAFGSYWYGVKNTAYLSGTPQQGQYGFYWQADQHLYRSSSKPSEKGLHLFSMMTYAPAYNNQLPFYFQAGLVYQGLFPTRDDDRVGIAYGYGSYSDQLADTKRAQNLPYATSQSVLEINYTVAVTKWLSVKPFYQLLINPAGNNTIKDANTLGFAVSARF